MAEIDDTTVLQMGDIVQITDENHAWFPALAVVDEVKAWGIQVCVFVPVGNRDPGSVETAYNRLENGQFKVVGKAHLVSS